MPFATAIETKILNHFLGITGWTLPGAAPYIGLSSTMPSKAGTGFTEPSGGAYARVSTTIGNWTVSGGAAELNAEKSWAQATADWLLQAQMVCVIFWDHLTNNAASNFLAFAALTPPRSVLSGDTAKILQGDLDLAFAAS